jgi:hypothetical protein
MSPPASWLERRAPSPVLRWEAGAVYLLAAAGLLSIPLVLGEFSLAWDAINHHIYLGWTAQHERFGQDFLGAGYQSFQSPYLYWPVYALAVHGYSGRSAGLALAALHTLVVPPLWMLARACAPGSTVFDLLSRVLAVALGLASALVMSVFDASMNDLLATAPLLWAVALALEPVRRPDLAKATIQRLVLCSGFLAGLAVGLKLSNGPLALCMPLLWLACARAWPQRLRLLALAAAAGFAGLVMSYGYWGWLLWRHFGNPVYPFYEQWFAPLRAWVGWGG